MIGSVIFLMVLGLVIFKMVYDYQLVKERLKMIEHGIQEKKEAIKEPVSRKSSARKPRGKNAGE